MNETSETLTNCHVDPPDMSGSGETSKVVLK